MPCSPQKVEELFHAALDRDAGGREAFLIGECGSDHELIAEVRSLLTAYEGVGGFLEPPPRARKHWIGPERSDTRLVSSIGGSMGRFKILSLLGSGGMGDVYLAEDPMLGRRVALKSLRSESIADPQAKKRLIREARAAATLDHPNICAVYEVDEQADLSFIVMQYIEGDTLSSKISSNALSLSESLDVAMRVADALGAAHSSGILHRDIKPQNIIVGSSGQVKVLDFGLAKEFRIDDGGNPVSLRSSITEERSVIGTAAYMSPEQAKGLPLDAHSDLFSLGSTIYECVAGRPAFKGDSLIEVCAQVIHVDPPPPSQFNPLVPPELDRVVLRALAKKPESRYHSASELMEDLRLVRRKIDPRAEALALPSASRRLRSRFRALGVQKQAVKRTAAFAAVACIAALGLVGLSSLLRIGSAAPHEPSGEARGWYNTGLSLLREGSYHQAAKALGRAVAIDNKFAMAHARLAEAWSELDYSDKAKDEMLLATTMVRDKNAIPAADSLYLDAVAATLRRDHRSAVELYSAIAVQADSAQRAQAYLDLGRSYTKSGNAAKAIESYIEAARLDPQSAAAYLRLGNLYGRQQDLKKAEESFAKAEEIYQAMSNMEGVAEVYYQRGALANSLDKVAEAQQLLEQALNITRTTNNRHQQIKVLLQLGSVAYTQGATAVGAEYATEAINLARADNLENLTTSGLIDLGNTFFQRGQLAEAEQYFKQALEFAERYKGSYSQARALLALGSLCVHRGDVDEAAKYLDESLAFFQQGGYRKESSQALILIGRVNRQRGEYEIALKAFEEELAVAREVGDQSQEASARSSIATLLGSYLDRYPEALAQFEQSYRIDEALGVQLNLAYDLMNRGATLWQLGRSDEARTLLDRAAAMAARPESGYRQLLATVYINQAGLEMSQLRLSRAESKSRKALDLAGQTDRQMAVQGRCVLGLAQALSGRARAGSALCAEAVELAKGVNNPRWLSDALLSLSEAARLDGDPRNAVAYALQAGEFYSRRGQQHSEWRALLSAAAAEYVLGDRINAREHASRAAALLSNIRQGFGDIAYATYLSRPDVQGYSRQIEALLADGR